jgi:predicted ATPase/DNA-binding SARP family transcriptional activator
MPDRLLIDVLGPLRARRPDGADATPDGALQRRLLAFLVLRRGRVVSVEAAIDVLWPTKPPRDPVSALHNHVFRLRRGLPEEVIDSTGTGYRMVSSAVDVDADRLAAALNAPQPADPAVAAAIDTILERWDGPAYPDLDDVDDGRAEAVRLDELRVRAVEARSERRLAAGASDELIAELAALADEHPLRERPRALLMSALAEAGRHVEALRVYDDFRRLLSDELGIDPSPQLSAQHAELLGGAGRTTWTPTSRLPVPLTSLVGRDELLLDVTATVERQRLVTLIGPGGVGKTRLLGEVGLRLRAARGERPVVMCELATAVDASAVDVVAAALAIDGRPEVGLVDRVAAVLADVEIVLLLDNCEHVLDPVAELVERLLATCPGVRIIATSRERLRVPSEQLFVVPPLDGSIDDAPAVQLFVERARAVAPGFDPTPADLALVGEIVRRLDGLPLAIELAAARLQTLDVGEVAAGLDRRFVLLSSGYRTSARHGSLHAALSWSFGLLEPVMQRIFADLSTFAGSFTAADAAAICGVDIDTATVALDQLVERCLAMRAPGRRYVLLETLRAFGAEQLASTARAELAGGRHARHFVEWVEAADRRMFEPANTSAVAEIDAALPELRAALEWLVDHDELDLAGRLLAPLLDYGFFRLRPDVLGWAEKLTAADPDGQRSFTPVAWAISAYAAWMAGGVTEAGARASEALRLSEQRGGAIRPEVSTMVGNYALFRGRLDEAVTWYRHAQESASADPAQRLVVAGAEALALAYAGDARAADAAGVLLATIGEATNAYAAYTWYCASEAAGDVDQARARLARALELAEVNNGSFVAGVAGAAKASIEARVGDPDIAAADFRRLITHWRGAGVWSMQWTMLRAVAGLLARLGRPREAAVLVGAVRTTHAGHDIFGEDERALRELESQLRSTLGGDDFVTALAAGAALDGEAAIELALRAL